MTVSPRIQRAVVVKSRPPNSDRDLFLVQIWLWEVLWSFFTVQPLSLLSPVVARYILFVTRHNPVMKWFTVVAKDKRRQHFKLMIFFFLIFGQLRRHPLTEIFHPSNLLQMLIGHKMADIEPFSNFSYSYKRAASVIALNWLTITLFVFKVPVSFAKLLETSLHCMFVSSSWVKCVVELSPLLYGPF